MGERRLVDALLGVEIASPYRPLPRGAGLGAPQGVPVRSGHLARRVFLLLQFLIGLVSFIVTTVTPRRGLGALAAPAWYWALPDGIDLGSRRWTRSRGDRPDAARRRAAASWAFRR